MLFDFIEETIATVSSSFAALEAFCNVMLVERMSAPRVVKTRNAERNMTAEEIERNVGTDEKLKRHVPEVLGVPSPAGDSVLWERYRRLKSLRDGLTHFKRGNLSSLQAQPIALQTAAPSDPWDHPETATLLIRRYFPLRTPRWLNDTWKRGI